MMSLVLLMLWLPSKLDYEQAMTLFVKEFKEHINDHVAKTYLDPKHQENLGGHAAGVKATSSSTNGVERRSGNYKTKTKGITAKLPTSEKNNFICVIESVYPYLRNCAPICSIFLVRYNSSFLQFNAS